MPRTRDYNPFATAEEAERYVRAMGRSRIYTAGGAPPLPRCDHPEWTLSAEELAAVPGRIASHVCTSRVAIDPGCPHVTMRHSDVVELRGSWLVAATRQDPSAAGERVDVDGFEVVLDRVPSRTLTADERDEARAHWPRRETDEEYTARRARTGGGRNA